ncbi:HAD-IIB family hydrolase [Ramlibacter albus]|uniref:HAD-IIB family hydrolase n=1 Tax=Ramlibacter albus TaxID=2079448 RepID=A0A923S236_9BURK|nr:HAD-IIB family hydrolase [Ramlibacter albus]MBC5764931.1 HAD-IIB family hydrolase [Ramlibacter albus]
MRPLADMPREVAAGIHTVFSDIDDTLTTEGKLTVEAYGALQSLQSAGVRVVLVTGRPAGWCDHIARMWPVDAVIGENGAFYFWYDHEARKLRSRHVTDEATRAVNAAKMAEVQARILREVPGCAIASDQFCRLYDIAIDFCEDVPALPESSVQRIVQLMEDAGMTAKVSSIHVNGWFGSYDKLSMAHLYMRERCGMELEAEKERVTFAGDSPNDAPMFSYLPHAVGVANVKKFKLPPGQSPAWVTPSEAGAGFAELARALLSAR